MQSSPRDRRIIFEEAAGISRFKMRKIEALRRLERVDQNLLRLHDIVEEVENRLRSVRAQAGKARRYKEYYDRLQELRTQVGLVDWRRLSERLNALEREIQSLTQQSARGLGYGRNHRGQAVGNRRAAGRDQRKHSRVRRPYRRRSRTDCRRRIVDRARAGPFKRSGRGNRPVSPADRGHERQNRQFGKGTRRHDRNSAPTPNSRTGKSPGNWSKPSAN